MNIVTSALILAISAVIIGSHTSQAATDKVFCYYKSYLRYRGYMSQVAVEDIDPNFCTHLIYSIIKITPSCDVRFIDSWLYIELSNFNRFLALKNQNPKLKVIVSQGGANQGSKQFSVCASNGVLRLKMVNEVIKFMVRYGFDGHDINWQYPADRDGSSNDTDNFILLLKLFREKFDPLDKILTAAVGVRSRDMITTYNVYEMAPYPHFILLMAFDMHGYWDGFVANHAPLYGSSALVDYQWASVDFAVTSWINMGAPPEKLILGIPFHGQSYMLSSTNHNEIGSPHNGAGVVGRFTRTNGYLGYMEICDRIVNWTKVFDNEQKAPYAYSDHEWVGYDNPASVKLKSIYAKDKGLGGVMAWAIDQDDGRNICGGGKSPLMNAIHEGLGTTRSTTTTYKITTCPRAGNIRNPFNCVTYYECIAQPNGTIRAVLNYCPTMQLFNAVSENCEDAENATC